MTSPIIDFCSVATSLVGDIAKDMAAHIDMAVAQKGGTKMAPWYMEPKTKPA